MGSLWTEDFIWQGRAISSILERTDAYGPEGLNLTVPDKLPLTSILFVIALLALWPLRQTILSMSNQTVADGACAFLAVFLIFSFVLAKLLSGKNKQVEESPTQDLVIPPKTATSSGKRKYKKICLLCAREFSDEFAGTCPEDKSELSRVSDYLAPGTIFSEYYEVIGPLGAGNLSKVFKARHISSGKQLAIKMMHSHLCTDPPTVQRFQREAKALSRLSHPNLVSVEDFMISPDGIPFIIMDYLSGESLQEKLSREKQLSWQETAAIFVQVCKGLGHAHSKGIIHRDLKPGNIMLARESGSVIAKIVDFGLAKTNQADSIGRITQTGEIFGSPLYMSPEQCRGQVVDRRSDVYALGCLLYECLNGKAPFIGKNAVDTLSLHINEPCPPFLSTSNAPPWMVEIVQKALQKEPGKRQQSIEDLGGQLQDGLRASR